MTKVTKSTYRESHGTVFSSGKHRPVIVEIAPPNLIGFRLKGTRKTYYLTTEGLYIRAVQAEVNRNQLEKARAKKEKNRQGRR